MRSFLISLRTTTLLSASVTIYSSTGKQGINCHPVGNTASAQVNESLNNRRTLSHVNNNMFTLSCKRGDIHYCSWSVGWTWRRLCISKHENRWARKRNCGCLNFILALSSTQFLTTPEVALQWRICPIFQVQKKIRNRAPFHANKRICSFPSAHLFYAAICSITILIVIKHHHFFSPLRNRTNEVWLLIHLYSRTLAPLFFTISILSSALFWHFHQSETTIKLPMDWPGYEFSLPQH